MTFKLLPPKWLSKRNDFEGRPGQEEQENPVYFLQSQMNRLFDDFFRSGEAPMGGHSFGFSPFNTFDQNAAVTPGIDVHETNSELLVSVELPGLTEKEIDVSLSQDMLTISGEKKQETEQNVKGWYRMERSYGTFTRSIPLPCDVDQESCKASFKNGVLTVSLSKTAQAQATLRSIPIKKD